MSIEGGGVFMHDGVGVAHYLVDEPERAVRAVHDAGLGPASVREVVLARLDQGTPGQLGAVARRLADAGVRVRVQYSDHVGHLVLVLPDEERASGVAVLRNWTVGGRIPDGEASIRDNAFRGL
ncbi:MAG: hypothetical protein J7523_10000 [Cellulomonas sp.]|nr:hypothetical protein [Cellulomonas sp.]